MEKEGSGSVVVERRGKDEKRRRTQASVLRKCRSERGKETEEIRFFRLSNLRNALVPTNSSAASPDLLTVTVTYAHVGNPASRSLAIVSNLSERRVTRPDMQ